MICHRRGALAPQRRRTCGFAISCWNSSKRMSLPRDCVLSLLLCRRSASANSACRGAFSRAGPRSCHPHKPQRFQKQCSEPFARSWWHRMSTLWLPFWSCVTLASCESQRLSASPRQTYTLSMERCFSILLVRSEAWRRQFLSKTFLWHGGFDGIWQPVQVPSCQMCFCPARTVGFSASWNFAVRTSV